MSFWKKLFGGGTPSPQKGPKFEAVEHEGYRIEPQPMPEGGQYRLCAVVSREVDGELRQHRLIRADLFPDAESAAETSIRKARQMIAEQGERIFR